VPSLESIGSSLPSLEIYEQNDDDEVDIVLPVGHTNAEIDALFGYALLYDDNNYSKQP
jgi:hypothetical protein